MVIRDVVVRENLPAPHHPIQLRKLALETSHNRCEPVSLSRPLGTRRNGAEGCERLRPAICSMAHEHRHTDQQCAGRDHDRDHGRASGHLQSFDCSRLPPRIGTTCTNRQQSRTRSSGVSLNIVIGEGVSRQGHCLPQRPPAVRSASCHGGRPGYARGGRET